MSKIGGLSIGFSALLCTWLLSAGPIAAQCFTSAASDAGGEIAPQVDINRVSGVAPLSVFFDASATSATATSRPIRDLAYCWDFGDPNSGAFSTTGRSKNEARGPVAGHVFETPGRYTVTLAVRDKQGRQAQLIQRIDVQSPDDAYAGENTLCFSSSGDFTGCPAGAQQLGASSMSEVGAHVATGRRLLLRRGDTFIRDAATLINVAGPGTIGAFGRGERPIIVADNVANGHTFVISADHSPQFSDWRIMDLDIRYSNWSGDCRIIDVQGTASNLLLARLALTGAGNAINMNLGLAEYWNANGVSMDMTDGLTVSDSEIRDSSNYAMFVSAHRFLWLGTSVSRATSSNSLVRFTWLDRAVISDNDIGPEAGGSGHILYIHGPGFSKTGITGGRYAERILISNNTFHPGDKPAWTVHIAPQNVESDERFRDVIVERNLFLPGASVQFGLHVGGSHQGVTIRDNLFRGANASGVRIDPDGSLGHTPADVELSHNTVVGDNAPKLAHFDMPAEAGITAYDNLLVGPSAALQSGTGTLADESGNQLLTADSARLASTNPMAAADFALQADSPAVDAGHDAFAGTCDYAGIERDGAPDVGALERFQ